MGLGGAGGGDERVCEGVVCAESVVDSWCGWGAGVLGCGGCGSFGGDDSKGLLLLEMGYGVRSRGGRWLVTIFAVGLVGVDVDGCSSSLVD